MRGTMRAMAATGLLLVLAAGGLAGQVRVILGAGGGVVVPTKSESSFGPDVKSLGYHLQLMLGVGARNSMIGVRVDGQYGSVNYEKVGTVTPKTKIFAVNGDLVLHPTNSGGVRPYLLAGPSYGHFSFRSGLTSTDETSNKVGFNAGAGLNFGQREKVWFFTEARYIYTKTHKYFPITVGVRINLSQAYQAAK
jgi:opacity protein-like surface antigen